MCQPQGNCFRIGYGQYGCNWYKKADEFAQITDDAELITALIRYAILNDHDSRHTLLSPDLSDILLSNKLPSVNRYFLGRKEEIKVVSKALQETILYLSPALPVWVKVNWQRSMPKE